MPLKSSQGSCPVLVHVTSVRTKKRATYALLVKIVRHPVTLLCDFCKLQICNTELTPINGRVLGCSHEICADCLLQLRGAPMTHDGQL